MVCHVSDDSHPAWRVGIEDPHHPQQLLATVEVRRGAIATSGTAHRGEHITDARTGGTPGAVASVTVLADDLTSADIDATAAYAIGADALAWLRRPLGPPRHRRLARRWQRPLRHRVLTDRTPHRASTRPAL